MSEDARSSRLLPLAALMLRSHDYTTRSAVVDRDIPLLLAENDYFALGVTEFQSPRELPTVAESAAAALASYVSDSAGAKRWDFYLVLLSQASLAESAMPEAVTTIVYNTTLFRRVVKWNLEPSEESVARALRSFLPLTAAQAGVAANPLERLRDRLPTYGLSEAMTAQTIEQFRASGVHDG